MLIRFLLLWTVSVAVAACSPVEELQAEGLGEVSELALFPEGAELSLQAGEAAALALQATNAEGVGVNGLEVFFGISDPALLIFEESAAGATRRISTQDDEVGGLSTSGLAVARVRAQETTEPKEVVVFAGLVSPVSDDAGSGQSDVFAMKSFRLTIQPASPEGGQ